MAVDPNIKKKADDIRNKVYGKEVRESLASGLEAMSTDVVDTVGRQDEVEGQFQDVIDETTGKDVISAPEIIAARNGEANLKQRLDKENQQVTAQLAQTIDEMNFIKNVKVYVERKDGETDTESIQRAFDEASSLIGGPTSTNAGYIGWFLPEIILPSGLYKVGTVETPSRFKLTCDGQAVIQSIDGSEDNFSGVFVDNPVHQMYVENITFIYFDSVFITPTNNLDFSFITFERCNFAKSNLVIDTVSYASSRSTTFMMNRCLVSYGIKQLCKLYNDKISFNNNWIIHSENSVLLEINGLASFRDNVWVPVTAGEEKAYIKFEGTESIDSSRTISFYGDRFGGESGSCPVVIVGDITTRELNKAYLQRGISFNDCQITVANSYQGKRAVVILNPIVGGNKTIDYVNFSNTKVSADLSGGVVQSIGDVSDILPEDFIIDYDYSSAISGTKGVNKLSSDNLLQFVHTPKIVKKSYHQNSGKLNVEDTQSEGIKKATFKIDRTQPSTGSFHTPFVYLVTTIGQGDSNSSGGLSYAYTSTYILTIYGVNTTSTHSKIAYTKLHGDVGGLAQGANADIVSAHFGNGDTGSDTEDLGSQTERYLDITITFGERINKGSIYVQPLFDFSLLS